MTESPVSNTIHETEDGFYLDVYDHREETMALMADNEIAGSGTTWMGLIKAALELESPETSDLIDFEAEPEVVLIVCTRRAPLEVISHYVSILMTDEVFMSRCIRKGQDGGYME
ncbi:MAG: hypothetical protein ACJAYE_003310 [Candidatus Azotimanducaceae bacterium]|jgi:hypothetical protein